MADRAPSAGRALRRVPATAVLAALGTVGVVTVVLAVLGLWAGAVTGLVVLHLGTALAVLGPWGAGRAVSAPKAAATADPVRAELQDLERRVDALGARLVAGTERARVEILDALAGSRPAGDDPR
ncbi:hypothetical protein GCM10009584_10630 [Ornithinimicrobium humiphilum]|uniref:Uncharacterized protein n=1 Tax=Ornithinimicrobium humiphilum TaxID=125288 RepID=A0A543KJC5_9MICO|nr:hypothetical protein [Ornithinimicrobium humiphilum]TQM90273.1 hypothetical protein FB476_3226 [Ornithinimicrobium humiphilum]TQM95172.1 hypothetical protein FB476_0005 [Ornithinimicrobium humiphilum]